MASLRRMAAWVWVGCLFVVPSETYASSAFSLDLGLFGDNLQQRLSAPAGYTTQVSSLSGWVRARPVFFLTRSITWEPSAAILVPWRSGNDGFAKTVTSFFAFDFGIPLVSWVRLRAGTALQWVLIWGQGNAVDLNNGTGTTTFYTPAGTSNGFSLLAEAGLEFKLAMNVSLGVEIWVSQIANASRRRFMGAAYLGVML